MQFNAAHASLREREKSNGTKIEGEEDDHDVVREISITKFAKQTKRKE